MHVTSEEKSKIANVVNPNLLDNWYFARPVNQRGKTEYTGNAYTIDRWCLNIDEAKASVSDDCIIFSSDTNNYINFIQHFEADGFLGKTVTFSTLVEKSGTSDLNPYITFYTGDGKYDGYSIIQAGENLVSCTVTLPKTLPSNGYFSVVFVGMSGASLKIKAAKLELGDTQTLAHKENGEWVLNEVPDYGEQLRRCQRYAFSPLYEAYATAIICNLFVSSVANGVAFGEVTLPVSMRNKSVFSGNASTFWIVAENGGGASHPTDIAVIGLSADKVMIRVNGSYAANTQYVLYVENPFTSADFLLSADL